MEEFLTRGKIPTDLTGLLKLEAVSIGELRLYLLREIWKGAEEGRWKVPLHLKNEMKKGAWKT